MKRFFAFLGLAGLGALAIGVGRSFRSSLVSEVAKRAHIYHFEEHSHEAIVHAHEHPHVTHNRRQGADEVMGEWEHLTAVHSHEHNHSALSHAHLAHEDAEHEHLGESHVHDHSHPTVS